MIQTVTGYLRRHTHTNWALADQAMVSGANFLTGVMLARGLGIAEFGRFSLAWLVVLFVQSIQDNSITIAMMSIGPKQEAEQRPRYYGGVFLQQVIFAVTSSILTWACLRYAGWIVSDQNIAPLAASLAATVLLCLTQDFLRRYFFVAQHPAVSFTSDAVRYLGQLAVLFWVLFESKPPHSVSEALWIMAGASGAGALAVAWFLERLEWAAAALRETALRNWYFSRWLIGAAIAYWMSGNLFVITAGAVLGVAAVGALKAAQSVMGITNILFLGLENVVPIRASRRYHAGGSSELLQYVTRVARLGLLATAIVGLIFASAPTFWFRLFYGEGFTRYSYLLRWYAALYLLIFLAGPLGAGLRAMERTSPIFLAYVVGAVFSLAAAYPLVRAFELVGVMVGLLFIQLLIVGVMAISFRHALVKRLHDHRAPNVSAEV
jgi:O-antigen/teichoic acid export membrane protein